MFGATSNTDQDLDVICQLHNEIIEASGGAKGVHSEPNSLYIGRLSLSGTPFAKTAMFILLTL
jgi:hypothetical protein